MGLLGRVDEGADGFVKPVFSLVLRDDNHRRYEQNGHSTVNRKVGVRESDICHDCASLWQQHTSVIFCSEPQGTPLLSVEIFIFVQAREIP